MKTVRRDGATFVNLTEQLLAGGCRVRFRAEGTSMLPTIADGATLTVAPVGSDDVACGDVVLCRRPGGLLAHRVVEVRSNRANGRVFILRGDGKAGCDAPVAPEAVLGKVVAVEHSRTPEHPGVKIASFARRLLGRLTRSARSLRSHRGALCALRVSVAATHGAAVETAARRLLLIASCLAGAAVAAEAQMVSGGYTGTGVAQSISQLGFTPDIVFVKGDLTEVSLMRTSTMTGDNTKPMRGATALVSNRITSLDTDGFTVGTDNGVNKNGSNYYFTAFKAVSGEVAVGSYTGNGASRRTITVGFQPGIVFLMSANAATAVWTTATSVASSDSYDFENTFNSKWFNSFTATGFMTEDPLAQNNANGVTYHWVAWKEVAGKVAIGTYQGNGSDNRNITGLGLDPEWVIAKDDGGGHQVHHMMAMGPNTDYSLYFCNMSPIPVTNGIQSLRPTTPTSCSQCFQVGSGNWANANGDTVYWMAWGRDSQTAVKLATASATRYEAGTFIEWKTGYEVDNLGFHVYREVDGARTRITPRLIAGSGLLVRQNLSTAGQGYGWWDREAVTHGEKGQVDLQEDVSGEPSAEVIYWIEDVDLNGTTTWHGPIRVTEGGGRSPAPADSALLTRLTKAADRPARDGAGMRSRSADVTDSGSGTWASRAVGGAIGPATRSTVSVASAGASTTVQTVPATRAEAEPIGAAATTLAPATESATVQTADGATSDELGGAAGAQATADSTQVLSDSAAGTIAFDQVPTSAASASGESTIATTVNRHYHSEPATEQASADEHAHHHHSEDATGTPIGVPEAAKAPSASPRSLSSRAPVAASSVPARALERGMSRPLPQKLPGLLAAGAAVKVAVDADGWYRVTQAMVTATGLKADVRSLRLFVEGEERPLKVTGSSRTSAAVEFYGTAANTPYTDRHVYWLVSGRGAPRRITSQGAATGSPPSTTSFPFTFERRHRETLFAALLNGEAENYFGEIITTEPTDVTLDVVSRDTASSGAAALEVVLQGVTVMPDGANHNVDVAVNGLSVGQVSFANRANVTQTLTVPVTQLLDGSNVVTLTATGGDEDVSLVDILRLTYARTFTAEADRLRFTAPGGASIVVGGFTDQAIRVVDVTDPAAVVELVGRVGAAAGGFEVALAVPGSGERTLLAVTDASVWTARAVVANLSSTWAAAANAADYVVIADAGFRETVEPLKSWRAGQGHRVAVVDVEDLYDEFSFGQKTPHAIRDFLVRAHAAWRTPPRFVLLVGNATTDPRNYMGMDEPDWVPTKMVPTTAFETASDEWFADADGDGVPELGAVGRLPARTPEQAATMVTKILAYERAAVGDWTKAISLVADATGPDDRVDFAGVSAQLRNHIPADYVISEVRRGELGTEGARAAVLAGIDAGQAVVNYVGHGSVQLWNDNLLTTDDVPGLANGARLPLFVMMNCLNGFFHGLFPEESLAEALVRAGSGGAVAVWASSGFTESSHQAPLGSAFYSLLFGGRYATVGEVVGAAKAQTTSLDVRRTWIFFGDPAMRLKGLPDTASLGGSGATGKSGLSIATPASLVADTAPAAVAPASGVSSAIVETVGLMPPARLSEWDGDGRADVLLTAASGWQAMLSTGPVAAGTWAGSWESYPAELNGDGLSDLLVFERATGAWVTAINSGGGQLSAFASGTWGSDWTVHVADFSGDGIEDVLLTDPGTGRWNLGLSGGSGWFRHVEGVWPTVTTVTVGDFSGDGRADAFAFDPATGAWTLARSEGDGRFATTSGNWLPGWNVRSANLGGDSRTDLVTYNAETGSFAECIAQPGGGFACSGSVLEPGRRVVLLAGAERDDELFYEPATGRWTLRRHQAGSVSVVSGTWAPHLTIATGDLDGDGRADLLLYDPASGNWVHALTRDPGPFAYEVTGWWEPGWKLAARP